MDTVMNLPVSQRAEKCCLAEKTRPVTFPIGTLLPVGSKSLISNFRSVTVRGLWLRDNLITEFCRYLCQFTYTCEGRSDNMSGI